MAAMFAPRLQEQISNDGMENQYVNNFRPYPRVSWPPKVPFHHSPYRQHERNTNGRKRSIYRKTIDYNASMILYLENRIWQRDKRDMRHFQPDKLYSPFLTPCQDMLNNPMNAVCTKFIRQSTNKSKCPIFRVIWTPEGRRLITGGSSGEFTLWNGLTFNFETILQAHDSAVRAMIWSHNDQWMVTADHNGFIKYWQSNMNNIKVYQAHKESVRGLTFCPSDAKFATASDDGTVRIYDFVRCHEERVLRGHGADVKCIDWHPQKCLIASGSKDAQQPIKLWDPRNGNSMATLHAHKNTVMQLQWNNNGNWLLTASKDHLLKLYDLRNMKKELQIFKGHKKEATACSWNPIHEGLFASAGSDGSIFYWIVGQEREVGSIAEAHEGMIWTLSWHPLGHIIASGSNDHSTKFWSRNRPGDLMRDKYNLNTLPVGASEDNDDIDSIQQTVPGLGFDVLSNDQSNQFLSNEDSMEEKVDNIPGLDFDDNNYEQSESSNFNMMQKKKQPYVKPIPKDFQRAWFESGPAMPPPPTQQQQQQQQQHHQQMMMMEQYQGPPPPQMMQQMPPWENGDYGQPPPIFDDSNNGPKQALLPRPENDWGNGEWMEGPPQGPPQPPPPPHMMQNYGPPINDDNMHMAPPPQQYHQQFDGPPNDRRRGGPPRGGLRGGNRGRSGRGRGGRRGRGR